MNFRIASLLAIVICAGTSILSAADKSADDQPAQQQAEITALISQLSADKYAVREKATEKLQEIGIAAAPQLLRTLAETDSETFWRATKVLEIIGLEGDIRELKIVMAGLAAVAGQGHPSLLKRSAKLANRYSEYKSQVAMEQIRKLGGQVQEFPANYNGFARVDVGFIMPMDGGIIVAPRRVEVELDRRMKIEVVREKIEKVQMKHAEKVGELDRIIKLIEGEAVRREAFEPDDKIERVEEDEPDEASDSCGNFDEEVEDVDESNNEQQAQQIEADEKVVQVAEVQLEVDDVIMGIDGFGLIDFPVEVTNSGAVEMARTITIDSNWKGGVEGLKYVAEVANVRNLIFNEFELTSEAFEKISQIQSLNQLRVAGCYFSGNDMRRFAADHPNVYITATGTAMLGVYPVQYTNDSQDGCKLDRIAEESGAAKAGLLAGDKIIRVDDAKVVDFPTLTYTVAGRRVGDELAVTIIRDDEEMTLKVKLGARAEIAP